MKIEGAVLVGLTGLARSGKDTAADVLIECFGFKRVAFADLLKEAAALLLGRPLQDMYMGDREAVMPEWGFSIRDFLQRFGTEAMRNNFGHDFWIKAARARVVALMEEGCRRFVISDVRFDNEADWVRDSGGTILCIHRPGVVRMAHASEAGVWEKEGDQTIHNDSTYEDYRTRVMWWAQERYG